MMIVSRYKPFFTLTASYDFAGIGVNAEGLTIQGMYQTENLMGDLKLKPQYKKNTATIFYEGVEKPVAAPTTCEPLAEINSDTYFFFSINLSDKQKIKGIKFHSSPAVAKEIGFPVLYDAFVDNTSTEIITAREDVIVMSPVFTLTAPASQTGITAEFALLEIRNEKNVLIDLKIPPVKLNDKAIDGAGAVPEFAFSVDASTLQPGVYEFKIGNFKKKFFLTTGMNISNNVSLIRVLKNNFLVYNKNLATSAHATFSLLIPKV